MRRVAWQCELTEWAGRVCGSADAYFISKIGLNSKFTDGGCAR